MADSDKLQAVLSLGGDPADMPFWEGCERGEFLLHQCAQCSRAYWPASRCVEHGDKAMQWVPASGRGTLHTWTVLHRAYLPSMKDKVPYVVGVVELEEGPFYHANIIGCAHESLSVGMPLQCTMHLHEESGLTVPQFLPSS